MSNTDLTLNRNKCGCYGLLGMERNIWNRKEQCKTCAMIFTIIKWFSTIYTIKLNWVDKFCESNCQTQKRKKPGLSQNLRNNEDFYIHADRLMLMRIYTPVSKTIHVRNNEVLLKKHVLRSDYQESVTQCDSNIKKSITSVRDIVDYGRSAVRLLSYYSSKQTWM